MKCDCEDKHCLGYYCPCECHRVRDYEVKYGKTK